MLLPRLLLCKLFIFLGGCCLHAQSFRFESLPTEMGFSVGTINDIHQDRYGFLWLATWSGLHRYDGYEIKSFQVNNNGANTLETNKITSIYEDSQGYLWLGTRRMGAYRYDPKREDFIAISQLNSGTQDLSNPNVWAITEDEQHRIWIATEAGLNCWDSQSGSLTHYLISEMPQGNFIYTLLYNQGRIWVGTEAGLYYGEIRANADIQFHYVSLIEGGTNISKEFQEYVYKVVANPEDDQELWVATKGGLKRLQGSKDWTSIEIRHYIHQKNDPTSLSHNFVQDILFADMYGEKCLWVATFQGLNLFEIEQENFRSYYADDSPYSLNNHTIRSLLLDKTGILWIGSERGVNTLNLRSKPFYTQQFPAQASSTTFPISTIVGVPDQPCVWAGTRGGGLFCLREDKAGHTRQMRYRLQGHDESSLTNFISKLLVDREENLWLLTQGAGAIRIDADALQEAYIAKKNYTVFSVAEGNLADNYVMSSYESRSGCIWLGHWNQGLDVYDPMDQRTYTFKGIPGTELDFCTYPIVALYETVYKGDSSLWVGTRGGGAYRLAFNRNQKTLTLKAYYHQKAYKASLSNNFLNAFCEFPEGCLWIGSENGLNRFELGTEKMEHFYTDADNTEGLPSNMIQGVEIDSLGRLWMSTQKGIASGIYYPESGKLLCQPYFKEDGLQDNLFNGNASFKRWDETLYFGGIQGMTYFNPHEIEQETVAPSVEIVALSLYNQEMNVGSEYNGRVVLPQSLQETEHLELDYRDRVISFSFAGMHFAQPAKNIYAYKLEGFDKDWVYTDANHRVAHYTNLSYRAYIFKVKAANPDGIWNERPAQIAFTLSPPWWLSVWAKFFYVLSALLILFVIRRVILIRLNYRNRLELAKVKQEKLVELDKMKSQFFTNISHELRTPLTLILTPLEELVRVRAGDKRLWQTFSRMHSNGHRLLRMINQILDLRRSDAGLMQLRVAEGDLVPFINEIVLSFRGLAEDKEIQLSFRPASTTVMAWFDNDQMEKVLYNLLSNAIKFTPKSGKVEVGLECFPEQEQIRIHVADTGIGIPEEDQPHIFQQFFQSSRKSTDGKYHGSGIGLALSKNIVEAHQGTIRVESEIGKGSSFLVELAMGDTHFSEIEKLYANQDREKVLHTNELSTVIGSNLEAYDLVNQEQGEETPKKLEVLLVEDNPDIRNYLKSSLQNRYVIWEASNGEEGLALAREKDLAMIVSDISMPVMDGITFCQQIKSELETSHIPVILLTARTSLIYKLDGLEKGADDYITKPFNLQLLISRIENLIRSRQKLRALFRKGYDLSPSELAVDSLDEQFLQKVLQMIEQHMDDPELSVEQMGKEIGLSRMQLYRKIKALTGYSPNQMIRRVRLKRAAQLLATQQYTVAEVTYQVGFQDLKYFRERFKKEYGVSPSVYADQQVDA